MYDIIFLSNDTHSQTYADLLRRYPHARALHGSVESIDDVIAARNMSFTEMFWLISDDIELPINADLSWKPPLYDRHFVHGWQAKTANGSIIDGPTGMWLIPRETTIDGSCLEHVKLCNTWFSQTRSFDVFFISYGESNADDNYLMLKSLVPNAVRVDGIKGINNAHRYCAELSTTRMFFTVDADTIPDIHADFSFVPPRHDRHYLHLWYSRNPVNGLEYGWGGIKLWPRSAVLDFSKTWLDFTSTVGNIKLIPEVISVSQFNSDELCAWRSGFREAVKLADNVKAGDHMDSLDRLWIWITVANPVDHADWCRDGARSGLHFAISTKGKDRRSSLQIINDFERLTELYYNESHANIVPPNRRALLDMILDHKNV